MARAPIEIAIASETRPFRQGIESGMIDPLQDADKALSDLGDSRGPEQLERDLRDAQRQTEDLADETKRTARTIETDFRESYRSAKRSADDGLDGMNNKAREVGDELKQNLGETFSSFRGDLEDLPQIAQDTLGGLAGSGALGGIPGLIATAAGAAGIGLLIGAFDQAGEAQERLKEKSNDWAQTFIENGSKVLSSAQLVAKGQEILSSQYAEVAENAKLWGVSEETALAAMAGSESALDGVTEALKRKKDAAAEDAAEAQRIAEANGSALLSLTPLEQEYERAKQRLDEHTQAMANGAAQADTFSYFLRDVAESTAGATREVDEFGDSVVTLPDGKQIYIDAETGQATMDVDAIGQKIYGMPDKDVTVNVRVNDIAWRMWQPSPKEARINVAGGLGGGRREISQVG